MNKPEVLAAVLTALNAELETLTKGARASFAAATDPDSRAENKYDTRTLEASYVARGQAMRVAELEEAVAAFQRLDPTPWPTDSAVAVGALVALGEAGREDWYLIGPSAGGTEVQVRGAEVMVITPASPLGARLMGQRAGASVSLRANHMARLLSVG